MIHVHNAQSVATALYHLTDIGHDVTWLHYGNVASTTKARNALVSEALHYGFQDLVFIDADIAFEPHALQRLITHDHDFVGGVQRSTGPNETFPYAVHPLTNEKGEAVFDVEDGVAIVKSVSTAFFRMRAEAVRELMLRCPDLQYFDAPVAGADWLLYALFDHRLYPHPTMEGRMKYHGEDYSFCELAREHGFVIRADLELDLTHIRPVSLSGAPIKQLTRAGAKPLE